MKKLVLGIVAVFCVQAGFILLTGTDQTSDLAFNSTAPTDLALADEVLDDTITPAQPEITVLRETTASPDEIVSSSEITAVPVYNPRTRKSADVETRTRPVVARSVVSEVLQPRPSNAPARVEFRNEYAAVLVSSNYDFSNYEMTARENGRTEGRSFTDKVMPKVKKPYSVLKSPASKLK